VTKSFTPAAIDPGTDSTLTVTLANPGATAATGVSFTDSYPTGLANTSTATTDCGGTATAGAGTLSLSGGTIPAGGICSVSVLVTASAAGTYQNAIPAGGVTSANADANATDANASLEVTLLVAPLVTKSFTGSGLSATLAVTLTNPNGSPITGVTFVDTYPGGMTNAPVPSASSTCGGVVTADAGAGTLGLSGGVIPANGSCTVSALVAVTVFGSYVNVIPAGAVTSANAAANAGAGASGTFVAAAGEDIPALSPLALLALFAFLACAAMIALSARS